AVLEQDGELFTSPAADNVGLPRQIAQVCGKGPQSLIAGEMAMLVVELLEVINVQHQGAERLALAASILQGLSGEQFETASVGQAGQLV
ncbi:hypothetical protein RCL31_24500, partial [Salmonella enterica subsp. enterica serovar Rissen]